MGVGTLTALAVVNTLGDVTRFDNVPKQVTNFIGYDSLDDSSSEAGEGLVRSARRALLWFALWLVRQL